MDYFSLGGISFDWTPNSLTYTDGHRIVQHDLIGGARVWHDMGPDPGPITLAGQITGASRSEDRDALRALLGTIQALVVGDDSTDVVVSTVEIDESVWGVISYRLTLLVATPAQAPTKQTSDQAVQGSVGDASDDLDEDAYPDVADPLSEASNGLLAGSSPADVLTSLIQAKAKADALLATADATIANVGAISAGASPFAAIRSLNALASALGVQADLAPVTNQIGRAINLTRGV